MLEIVFQDRRTILSEFGNLMTSHVRSPAIIGNDLRCSEEGMDFATGLT